MKKFFLLLFSGMFLVSQGCTSGKTETSNVSGTTKNEVSNPSKKEIKAGAIHLNKADFLTKVWNYEVSPEKWVYNGDKPCIIDFYADWCGPCKMIAPIMEQLSTEYDNKVDFYKIDTEDQVELASMFGIRSIPSILFVPAEGQPQMAAGALPKASFKQIISEVLKVEQN